MLNSKSKVMERKLYFLFVISLLVLSKLINAQAPEIVWADCYGGTGDEIIYSIIPVSDGYILGGKTNSTNGDISGNNGSEDIWIVKIDNDGDTIWTQAYGGSGEEVTYSLLKTTGDSFIIAGTSSSSDGDVFGNHGLSDFWIINCDENGDTLWTRCYGGSNDDFARDIVQTSDDGYIITGYSKSNDGDVPSNNSNYDYWILKIDEDGDIIWSENYGGTDIDFGMACEQITGGNLLVSGSSRSSDIDVFGNHGNFDFWVLCLDNTSGDTIWTKSYGGSSSEFAQAALYASDGSYYVSGHTYSNNGDVSGFHGGKDYWVIKLNTNGDTIWTKALGGTDNDWEAKINACNDNNMILTGHSNSTDGDVHGNHGLEDFWLLKLDNNGDTIWTKSIGGTESDKSFSFLQDANGSYVAAGFTDSNDGDVSGNHGGKDFWAVKLDSFYLSISPEEKEVSFAKDTLHIKISANTSWTVSDTSDWITVEPSSGEGYDTIVITFERNNTDTTRSSIIEFSINGVVSSEFDINQLSEVDWTKCYSGTFAYADYCFDGGFIQAGIKNNDVYIVKTDSVGDTLWTKTYGGSSEDFAESIKQTSDSGYIVAANTYSNDGDVFGQHGNQDYWILKLDNNGDTIWTKCLGGTTKDYAYDIIQSHTGDYVVTGYRRVNNGSYDFWTVKLDSNSNIVWNVYNGNPKHPYEDDYPREYAHSIDNTNDSAFIIAGRGAYSLWGRDPIYVVKIDNNGSTNWTNLLHEPLRGFDSWDPAVITIKTSFEDGYFICGIDAAQSAENYYLLKLDHYGDKVWTKTYGGSEDDQAYDILKTIDRKYIISGHSNSYGNKIWSVKINESGDTLWTKSFENLTGPLNTLQTTDLKLFIGGINCSALFNDLPYIYSSPSHLNIDSLASQYQLITSSTTRWYASTNADWLILSDTSDNGYDTIMVNSNTNTTNSTRFGEITFRGFDVDSFIVTVLQLGNHYTPVWDDNPYQPMNLIINNALLDHLPLQYGNQIGVFCSDGSGGYICVGRGTVTIKESTSNPLK